MGIEDDDEDVRVRFVVLDTKLRAVKIVLWLDALTWLEAQPGAHGLVVAADGTTAATTSLYTG